MNNIVGFLSIVMFLLPIGVVAQYDFENWVNGYSIIPFLETYPKDITSSHNLFPFAGQSVFKTTEAYEGEFAVKIYSKSFFNEIHPGVLAIDLPKVDYTNFSFDPSKGGLPLNGDKVSIDFYYNWDEELSNDKGLVSYAIYRQNDDQIAVEDQIVIPNTTEWENLRIEFDYDYMAGDSIAIQFFSSATSLDNGLHLDNINVNSISTSTEELKKDQLAIFPNPYLRGVHDAIHIGNNVGNEQVIFVESLSGCVEVKDEYKLNAYLRDANAGLYFIRIGSKVEMIVVQ